MGSLAYCPIGTQTGTRTAPEAAFTVWAFAALAGGADQAYSCAHTIGSVDEPRSDAFETDENLDDFLAFVTLSWAMT